LNASEAAQALRSTVIKRLINANEGDVFNRRQYCKPRSLESEIPAEDAEELLDLDEVKFSSDSWPLFGTC